MPRSFPSVVRRPVWPGLDRLPVRNGRQQTADGGQHSRPPPGHAEGGLRSDDTWGNSAYEATLFARKITKPTHVTGAIDLYNLTSVVNEPRIDGAQYCAAR